MDDLVDGVSSNEVIVEILGHLAPYGQLLLTLLTTWRCYSQRAIRHIAVRQPVDEQLHLLSCSHRNVEPARIGVPCLPPMFGHYLLAVDVHFGISGVVEIEMIVVINRCLEVSFIGHMGAVELETGRQMAHVAVAVALQRQSGQAHLVADAVLGTCDGLAVAVGVGTGKVSCHTILVIETESAVQRQVLTGVAEAAIAVAVPQNAIAFVAHHKGHADLGVVLIEFLVQPFHVQLVGLVLSESIECFAFVVGEAQQPRPSMLLRVGEMAVHANFALRHRIGKKLFTASVLSEDLLAVLVVEADQSRLLVDFRHCCRRVDLHVAAVLRYRVTEGRLWLFDNDKTLLLGESLLAGSLHADDLLADDLQAHPLRVVGTGMGDLHGDEVAAARK